MAVPKKKTSKAKKNSRKSNWINKAALQASKAFSLANSIIKRKSKSFVYVDKIEETF